MRVLEVPCNDVPAIGPLFQRCTRPRRMLRLSEAVVRRTEVEGEERPFPKLHSLLQQAAPTLARLLYTDSPMHYYTALRGSPSLSDVLSMAVASVERVVDWYSLPGSEEVPREGAVSLALRSQPKGSGRLTLLVASGPGGPASKGSMAGTLKHVAQAVAGGVQAPRPPGGGGIWQ